MAISEKQVFYQAQNTYSTLYKLTDQTEYVWFVCHGLGYLSRYFISYFNCLDKTANYIIAPQAPSKYYQSDDFKYIGASWLTRENTMDEAKNILAYFDAVSEEEAIPADKKRILFGFSQGVSVSLRWMAARQINCDILVIYAGGIPEELTPGDFSFINKTKVKMIYGKEDPYINEKSLQKQLDRAENLFGKERIEVIPFDGKHEVKSSLIKALVEE